MAWDFRKLKFWEKAPLSKPEDQPVQETPEARKVRGQLEKFLKTPKGAAAAKWLQGLVERMKKDGVDVQSEPAVKAWVEKHRAELEKEEKPASQAPFVRSAHKPGRNDPCHCGSGKKYKKCCEAKEAKVL